MILINFFAVVLCVLVFAAFCLHHSLQSILRPIFRLLKPKFPLLKIRTITINPDRDVALLY